jgi:hypothetical protein
MFIFLAEKNSFLVTDAAEEVVKRFWNAYHTYRYDMHVSFLEFLRGNGVRAKKVSPRDPKVFRYNISGIDICLN